MDRRSTNQDRKYLRVKTRDIILQLKNLVSIQFVNQYFKRMENAKAVLNDVATEAFNKYVSLKRWGDIEVNKEIFFLFAKTLF